MVEVPVEVWGRVEGQSVVNVIIFCHIDRPKEVKWQLMIASCYRRSGKIVVYVNFGSSAIQRWRSCLKNFSFFHQATINRPWKHTSQYTGNFQKILNVNILNTLYFCTRKWMLTYILMWCRFKVSGANLYRSWLKRCSGVCAEINESRESKRNKRTG